MTARPPADARRIARRAVHRPHEAVSRERLGVLAATLGHPVPPARDAGQALAQLVDARDRRQVWLALAVLSGRLPDETTVVETSRAAEFTVNALADAVVGMTTPASLDRTVRVVTGRVVVDVAHTTSTALMTGIQRVARETTRRWISGHDVLVVSWTANFDAMRDLTSAEVVRIERAEAADESEAALQSTDLVVPWRCRIIVPELAIEPPRVTRMRALARFSGNAVGAIGFDMIPLTTAETTAPGMPAAFAATMTALRHADRIVPISEGSAVEYRGWRTTLAAIGVDGPDIQPVRLPIDAVEASDDALRRVAQRLLVGSLPMVLVVGSHEPRKNHLAVLHAAEVLWRERRRFSLTFVGANSWGSEEFDAALAALQAAGRAVESVSKISDEILWAAYRLASFTVFPSLNEGYGLPVAESLAAGTPVITSRFGSMREIAEEGGALLVDPRSDVDVRDAMRRLLDDDDLRVALARQAVARTRRTWDEYAENVWAMLGSLPQAQSAGREPLG